MFHKATLKATGLQRLFTGLVNKHELVEFWVGDSRWVILQVQPNGYACMVKAGMQHLRFKPVKKTGRGS